MKQTLFFLLFLSIIEFSLIGQDVIINEFMAVNNTILQDEDGDYSDWIELYNPGTSDIDIGGWYLSDENGLLTKWVFPNIVIEAKSYLIVFASGKDRNIADSELHANFKLSGSGEYLALVKPGGLAIASSFSPAFPIQYQDVSYGIYNNGRTFFSNSTPGAENVESAFVAPPEFNTNHGFFKSSFNLEITKESADLDVYYTTDASTPSLTNGNLYTVPILISTTTIVRAVAVKSGVGASESISASYIFPEKVKLQSEDQLGYPATWLTPIHGTDDYDTIPSNYSMKSEFVSSDEVSKVIIESLESLPVVSIVTDIDNLFSEEVDPNSGGIYTYNGEPDGPTRNLEYHIGRGWIRPASVEYFNSDSEDGSIDFQANCAIKIHGGATRTRAKTEKHSFKIGFKSDYGPSKLKEKMFGKGSPKQYDWLVLRGGFAPRLGQQIKDPWAKLTTREMGQYAPYSKFVHVYINGLYWGMYNLSERLDENCMRDNLGGSSSDYDILKDYYEVETGDTIAWDKLVAMAADNINDPVNYQKLLGNNADGTPNPAYEKLVNSDNIIDYIMMNMYAGTGDWDKHNWAAARKKTDSEGFHFLVWDAEGVFKENNVNSILSGGLDNRPTGIFSDLIKNEQFKNQFISRVNKHFFEDGALTPKPCLERYENILSAIDTALISDQARWVYDNKDIWNTGYHDFIFDYFPTRTNNVFNQFVSAGIYPRIKTPVFNLPSSTISDTFDVYLSTLSDGEILYSLDGTDPGHFKISNSESIFVYDNEPLPLELGTTTISARVKQDTLWSRLMTKKVTVINENGSFTQNVFNNPDQIYVYPNPVEDEVQVAFSLSTPSQISIQIYNIFGQEVVSLISENWGMGEHRINRNMSNLPSGIYFCVLENHTNSTISKIKLLKK